MIWQLDVADELMSVYRVLSLVLGSKTDFSKMIWLATLLARSAHSAFAWAKSILMRPDRTTVMTLVRPVCFLTGLQFWRR